MTTTLLLPRTTHFYPRPPRGGRRTLELVLSLSGYISIHALREEGDSPHCYTLPQLLNFYPRPPRGGRPKSTPTSSKQEKISIHALREEGDAACTTIARRSTRFLSTPSARRATDLLQASESKHLYFYPRPPRGGRPGCQSLNKTVPVVFLSTPSARRATRAVRPCPDRHMNFYPRPPRGGRQKNIRHLRLLRYFYPRPPRGGRPKPCATPAPTNDFYPRPPRGGRPIGV